MNKIAYLTTCYPCVSHTFISREINTLRNNGMDIKTYSMNYPKGPFSIGSIEEQDVSTTKVLRENLLNHIIKVAIFNPSLLYKWFKPAYDILSKSTAPFIKKLGYALEGLVLSKSLLENNVNHIHVHFVNPSVDVAMVASKIANIPWSISIHGPDSLEDITKFDFIRRVSSAHRIRVISEYAKAQTIRFCGDVSDKIDIIHCGVEIIPPTVNRKKSNQINGLTVGRLVSAKGQAFLLKAIHKLIETHNIIVNWEFIGDGPDENMLIELRNELNLVNQVIFHGAKDQQFVQSKLEECSIFVLPSLAEGIPVSLMEAMLKGVPVISSRINGIPELIDHKENGYLCKPTDVDDLHSMILKCIKSPQDEIIKKGYNTICDKFNSLTTGKEMGIFFTK